MDTQKLEPTVPSHIAIIMDGNRRWAKQHNLDSTAGHKQAITRMEELIEEAAKQGISHITFWAWSTKNWKRSRDFVDGIIALFRENLHPDGIFAKALSKGAELQLIGSMEGFPNDIQVKVTQFLQQKPKETTIHVNLAVGYEGRDEIARAIKKIIEDGVTADQIDQSLIDNYLDTKGQPAVDFVIRTGGEKRTSGYLIWQAADAELYFTDTFMPDFGAQELTKALEDYSHRERRLGGDSKRY